MLSTSTPADVTIDPVSLQRVTAYIDSELLQGTFPGAALVATRHGKTFIERYWGTYSGVKQDDLPFDGTQTNMLFSFSKGISATVVVMAHQDGLLDYDAPLSIYIPEYRGGGKDGITVRHLLTHSAGIPTPPFDTLETEEKWDAAVEACCRATVEWEPGSKTDYHAATGMFLAAEIVRRATPGRPSWEAICRERLFNPLGATSLSFLPPDPAVALARTPRPQGFPAPITPENFGLLGHPGGGCFGKIEDMLKILHLHLNRGVWNGQTLITPSAWEEMHTVQYAREISEAKAQGRPRTHDFWGLGWLLRGERQGDEWFGLGSVPSPRAFGHAGIDTVMTVADPENDVALVFMTTDSPKPGEKTIPVRNTVTDLLFSAVR